MEGVTEGRNAPHRDRSGSGRLFRTPTCRLMVVFGHPMYTSVRCRCPATDLQGVSTDVPDSASKAGTNQPTSGSIPGVPTDR